MKKFLSNFYIVLVFAFLYLPIFVLIAFSFNETKGNVWTGFSFKWYNELINNELILTSVANTLIIAIISALVAAVLGTAAAFGMHNMRKLTKNALKNATYLQNLNPEIVTGISLMLLFTFFRLTPGYLTLILAHITFCLPTVVLSVLPKLRQMNVNLYEAAMDLGCNRRQAFFKVVLPAIMPGIISGLMMAFTLSVDDFIISYFVSGTDSQTLPIRIFSMTKRRVTPDMYALSTIIFLAILVLLIISNVVSAQGDKKLSRKGGGKK